MSSKKLYEATAKWIKKMLEDYPQHEDDYIAGVHDGIAVTAKGLCDLFFEDNDRFNSHTFLVACGLREEVK